MSKNRCKTTTRDPPKIYSEEEYATQYMFYINRLRFKSGLRPSVVPKDKEKTDGLAKK